VKIASLFGVSLTVIAWIIAPQLQQINSIFEFLQRVKSIASLPILTIFLVGIYTVRPDAFSAKFAFVVGAVAYGLCQLIPRDEVNFLHTFFACFILATASMALATFAPPLRRCLGQQPRPTPYEPQPTPKVSISPWRWVVRIVVAIFALVALLTLSLQIGSLALFVAFWVLWVVSVVVLMALPCSENSLDDKADAGSGSKVPGQLSPKGGPDVADPECPAASALGFKRSEEREVPASSHGSSGEVSI